MHPVVTTAFCLAILTMPSGSKPAGLEFWLEAPWGWGVGWKLEGEQPEGRGLFPDSLTRAVSVEAPNPVRSSRAKFQLEPPEQ